MKILVHGESSTPGTTICGRIVSELDPKTDKYIPYGKLAQPLSKDRFALCEGCSTRDDEWPTKPETVETEVVEVVRNYSRTCCKCHKVERGQAKSFHWNELNKIWKIGEYEFPKGWAVLHHTLYRNKQIGTVFNIYLCPDCVPSVLEFVGWADRYRWRKHTGFDSSEIWDYLGDDGFIFGTVLTFADGWAAYIGPVANYTLFNSKEEAMEWVLTQRDKTIYDPPPKDIK